MLLNILCVDLSGWLKCEIFNGCNQFLLPYLGYSYYEVRIMVAEEKAQKDSYSWPGKTSKNLVIALYPQTFPAVNPSRFTERVKTLLLQGNILYDGIHV